MHGQTRGWVLLLVATPVIVAAGAGLASLNRRLAEPLRDFVRTASARRRIIGVATVVTVIPSSALPRR